MVIALLIDFLLRLSRCSPQLHNFGFTFVSLNSGIECFVDFGLELTVWCWLDFQGIHNSFSKEPDIVVVPKPRLFLVHNFASIPIGFCISILIWIWSVVFYTLMIQILVQRTSMSFKSSFGALEDAGGS